MAERSSPWATGAGDGTSYSADYLRLWLKCLTISAQTPGNLGVLRGQLFELLVSSTGNNNIHVRSGRAIVDNTFYENDGTQDITVSSPGVGTTGKRLVLRKSWAAETVRLTIITSADGTASLPALTQTDGVTWDVPLASFTIATTGVIASLTDERQYVVAPDARRERWFPVTAGTTMTTNAGTAFGTHPGAQLATGSTTSGWVELSIPFDFVTLISAFLVTVTAAAGNIQRQIDSQYGAVGENPSTANTGTIAAGTRNMSANLVNEESVSSILSAIAAGDYVGIQYQRIGADAADVNTGTTQVLGLRLVYSATT